MKYVHMGGNDIDAKKVYQNKMPSVSNSYYNIICRLYYIHKNIVDT